MCTLVVLGLAACASLSAAEYQLHSCDEAASWNQVSLGAATAASTAAEGAGAVHVSLDSAIWDWRPSIGFYVNGGAAGGSTWSGYEGLRFWARGDGSGRHGVVSLIYDGSYYRYYAPFEMTDDTWTEITIPWREFTQRHMRGRIEDHVEEIHTLQFTHATDKDPVAIGSPYVAVPALSFDVDNIRLVNGLSLDDTPTPSLTSIDNVVAKMRAHLPVVIGWTGASISYGNQCSGPQEVAPYLLQEMLKVAYGYSEVTVVNRSSGGANSFTGFCTMDRYFADAGELDLVVFGEYFYNDHGTAPDNPAIAADIADNHTKIFSSILRRRNVDVLCYLTGIRFLPGDLTFMDPYAATMRSTCDSMGITYADVYADFQSIGYDALLAGGYYPADDVHYGPVGQQRAAETVRDAILAVTPAVRLSAPASATAGDGVLSGQGSVSISLARHEALTVTIASDRPSIIAVPAMATIPAGMASIAFDLEILDDASAAGNQTVSITVSGPGYDAASSQVLVHCDNDPIDPADPVDPNSDTGDNGVSCAQGQSPGTAAPLSVLVWLAMPSMLRLRKDGKHRYCRRSM